ncbi:MAG: DUF1810 family protein [Hyphomonadaceae bacterium]|nr:DUF1810 family protein [Hyphomonadaceae bacterium]GIK50131.1 MAG: calpastatin [Alphaproteobacteria bacterium]
MFEHFIAAQDPVYPQVLAELRTGQKRNHWMWFIFPQLRDLGRSATAQHFGLAGLAEARAYAGHALLGGRLRECVTLANAVEARTARQVFGTPDDLKYRSCVTLFGAATAEPLFQAALDRFYDGAPDALTLELIGRL